MTSSTRVPDPPPRLLAGDNLSRAEFEQRYAASPEALKAELIEGVVHVAPPTRIEEHGSPHAMAVTWLGTYAAATPGVQCAAELTVRLDLDNEPQPDAVLRILPAFGGQSSTSADGFVEGAPELVVEIAASSASYDLHEKLHAYRRNGVLEYVVWRVLDAEIDWLVLDAGRYVKAPLDDRGHWHSRTFPGLRLDAKALLAGDLARVLEPVAERVRTEEHAVFVRRLGARLEP